MSGDAGGSRGDSGSGSESESEPAGRRRSSDPLRPYRAGYWFGGFNGLTWMIGLGTPMVLLTEELGGSALQVGLATSFVTLLHPVQVVATNLLSKLGFRRQMVLAWTARAFFLLVPLALVIEAPREPAAWMPGAVVLSVFGFCVCRAFGVAAHIPWFAAILPETQRGRFFATDNAITSVVGVATLLSCAILFDRLESFDAFRAVYGVAMMGSVLAILNLLRLPTGPRPAHSPIDSMMQRTVQLTFEPGLFRRYLVVSLLWLFATAPLGGFAAYYLKVEAGVSSSAILAFTAVQFVGQIVGATSIRRFIDRLPIRWFFQAASGTVILVSILWLTVLGSAGEWTAILWGSYALFGLAAGLSQACHFTYLPELSAAENRPVTIAIFGAVSGMLSGASPVLWGFVLRTEDGGAGVDLDRFPLFFGVTIALAAIGMWKLRSLPDSRAGVQPG